MPRHSYAPPVKPPAHQRAFIALLAGLLVPLALTASPAASAEEPLPWTTRRRSLPPGRCSTPPSAAVRRSGSSATSSTWPPRATTCAPRSSAPCCGRTRASGSTRGAALLRRPGAGPDPGRGGDAGGGRTAVGDLRAAQQPGGEPDDPARLRRRRGVRHRAGTRSRTSRPGDHPAWDPAGDGPAFSDGERAKVQQVWAMVAEDYAPFDVDVTTQDPGAAGMVRSSSSDTVYGTRVLVTPSDDPFAKICSRACGGVAYIGVFDRRRARYYQPAWVFPQALGNDPKNIAEAASHEAGHNLGLDHDGTAAAGLLRRARRVGADHGRRLRPAVGAVEPGLVPRRQQPAGRPEHPDRLPGAAAGRGRGSRGHPLGAARRARR